VFHICSRYVCQRTAVHIKINALVGLYADRVMNASVEEIVSSGCEWHDISRLTTYCTGGHPRVIGHCGFHKWLHTKYAPQKANLLEHEQQDRIHQIVRSGNDLRGDPLLWRQTLGLVMVIGVENGRRRWVGAGRRCIDWQSVQHSSALSDAVLWLEFRLSLPGNNS